MSSTRKKKHKTTGPGRKRQLTLAWRRIDVAPLVTGSHLKDFRPLRERVPHTQMSNSGAKDSIQKNQGFLLLHYGQTNSIPKTGCMSHRIRFGILVPAKQNTCRLQARALGRLFRWLRLPPSGKGILPALGRTDSKQMLPFQFIPHRSRRYQMQRSVRIAG